MEDRKKILIVDDEEGIRYTFKAFLSREGFEVKTAGSYEEALSLLEQKGFDLLIADVILGDRPGFELIDEARKKGISFKIIVITGYPNEEGAGSASRVGAFGYLSKPIDKNKLLEAVLAAFATGKG